VPATILEIQIRHTIQTANGIMPMEIDVCIEENSIVAITGESGAGKTTLLRQIAGFVHPSEGHIRFGHSTWFNANSKIHVTPQNRNVGFVFQDYALFPHLTVYQNLKFALNPGQSEQDISDLLEAVELSELANRKPNQLSGGQKQRVALARALVRRPRLLLLDEPLAALDPDMRNRMQIYLQRLQQKHSFTALIVTHDISEIFHLARYVIVLSQGKIIQKGTPQQVYSNRILPPSVRSMYGKILTVQEKEEHLKIQILIANHIKEVIQPLNQKASWIPGNAVLIHYHDEISNIELL
jgi:molybdate transport system ATP-binding protein